MRRMLGVALVLALGCGDDKNNATTEGSSDGTTGSSGTTDTSTSMTPTSGTTGDSGTMGGTQSTGTSSPTTTGMTTGTDSTGGSTTVTDTTTSGSTTAVDTTTGTTGGGGIEEQCGTVCDALIDCQLAPPDPAMCVDGCLGDFGGAMGECQTALEGFLACMATMTCDELIAFFQNDDPGPCADPFMTAEMACDGGMPGDCTVGVSSNPQGTECSLQKGCQGQPPMEMQCDQNQCVCLVDGVEAGMCPSDGICKMEDQLEQKAADCCGF